MTKSTKTIISFFILLVAVLLIAKFRMSRSLWKPSAEPIALTEPIQINAHELDNMLYVYTIFFAIGHDRWLASEASMVKTRIEITDLPDSLSKEEQLQLFPGICKALENPLWKIFFRILDKPESSFMHGGVFLDPSNNRILLLHGPQEIQDGYGAIVKHLDGATIGTIRIDMRFLPGGYGDPGDLHRFGVGLGGKITDKNIIIDSVSGRIASQEKINALLAAAKQFDKFASIKTKTYRYTLLSEEEARDVEKIGKEVASLEMEDIKREGKDLIVVDRAYDLGLLVAYIRYGRDILNAK